MKSNGRCPHSLSVDIRIKCTEAFQEGGADVFHCLGTQDRSDFKLGAGAYHLEHPTALEP